MKIRREIESRAGRVVSIGATYATLDRMVEAGFVRSWLEEGGQERDGQPRRMYKLTAEGQNALRESLEMMAAMTAGLKFAPRKA
jgi:DNA-binding PadR family transcriptional regulator